MKFNLHLAICHANNAIGQMMSVDFNETHGCPPEDSIRTARDWLAQAAAELNLYDAKRAVAKEMATTKAAAE